MISTLMFTSPAKIKLSSRSSIHYWKTKSKYWVDCWELNFQKFEELDLTGFYCVIIYWYDWLQCTCSKLTQVQDIMRHGLTFKTSNKQLNRPSSAYRGIFRQIKHTYFIFFKHILFILRIKTTDPFFFSLPIDANSSQTLVINNPFFSMHGTTFPKKCFHFIFEINQSKYFNLNILHQCMRVIHISLHGLFDWGY